MRLAKDRAYMQSGHFDDIFVPGALAAGDFTTAHLEFYRRLGNLARRIDAHNASGAETEQIHLTLYGPEPVIDTDHWSFAKRDHYFVYERDSLVARNVADYIRQNPEQSILAFYGRAHLQRGLVSKGAGGIITEGRFLAAYLDSLYPGRICTIGQVTPDYWSVRRALLVYGDTTDIFPTHDDDPSIQQFLAGPMKYDWLLVRPRQYAPSLILGQIPSMHLMRLAVESLPEMKDTINDFYMGTWLGLLSYFYGVSAMTPHRVNPADRTQRENEHRLWENWIAYADSNIVPEVVSLRLWTRLCDSIALGGKAAGFRVKEVNTLLPCDAPYHWMDRQLTPPECSREIRSYLTANRDDLVTNALIGILWVGSDAERASAQQALADMTGQFFTDPADWADWRRRRP